MNSEHPNLSIVNRILDILDALRQGQPDEDFDRPVITEVDVPPSPSS